MSQGLRLVPSDDKENNAPEDEPMPETANVLEGFAWTPRPYKFTFDHTDSGFDARTYAASVRDIDAPSAKKAAHCVKLVREIDTYHRQHEGKYFPEPDYIGSLQTDINEKMRTILIDWLVEVGEEYELDSQTFHKAVRTSFDTALVMSMIVGAHLVFLVEHIGQPGRPLPEKVQDQQEAVPAARLRVHDGRRQVRGGLRPERRGVRLHFRPDVHGRGGW